MKHFLGVLLLVAASASAEGESTVSSVSPAVDDTAVESADLVMRRLSDYLVALDGFQLRAAVEFDDVPVPGIKVEYTGTLEIDLARPDRLHVDFRDDLASKQLWIGDGKVTLFDPDHGLYATTEAEGDLDATLNRLYEDFDLTIPLDGLLAANPYEHMMAKVTRHRYLGLHDVGGVPCHHAIFEQQDMAWQIWVEAGDTPRLRKLVITYLDEPLAPRYSVEIESFDPGAPAESSFRTKLPADVHAISFRTLEEKP